MTSVQVKNNLPGEAEASTRTVHTNDAWGRNTQIIYYDAGQPDSIVEFDYNHRGDVTRQYKSRNYDAPKGASNQYIYNTFGQLTTKTDAMGYIESYTYDTAGRVSTVTDRNGTVHTTTYDLLGQPKTVSAVKGGVTQSKGYTYDSMGNLLTVNDGTQIITYTYDGKGNRLTETAGNTVKTFTYNTAGLLTGYTITVSGMTQINVSYTYDNMGTL